MTNTPPDPTDRQTAQGPVQAADWFSPRQHVAQPGDLVMMLTSDHKRYLTRLRPGQTLHTHLGAFRHDGLIGQVWGTAVASQIGHQALILEPSLTDLILQTKRGTQIIYPKDAAYIVHRLSLRAGSRVIEAGTGSGGLTTALAWAVAPTGMVYTHEVRPDIFAVARFNLERLGLLPFVRMFQTDIDGGFGADDVDAVFLDVREPWLHLSHVRTALRPGGFFASLLPTTNQVIELLSGLEEQRFADIAVEELLLPPVQTDPRPFSPRRHAHRSYRLPGLCPLYRCWRRYGALAAPRAPALRSACQDADRERGRSGASYGRTRRRWEEVSTAAAALNLSRFAQNHPQGEMVSDIPGISQIPGMLHMVFHSAIGLGRYEFRIEIDQPPTEILPSVAFDEAPARRNTQGKLFLRLLQDRGYSLGELLW